MLPAGLQRGDLIRQQQRLWCACDQVFILWLKMYGVYVRAWQALAFVLEQMIWISSYLRNLQLAVLFFNLDTRLPIWWWYAARWQVVNIPLFAASLSASVVVAVSLADVMDAPSGEQPLGRAGGFIGWWLTVCFVDWNCSLHQKFINFTYKSTVGLLLNTEEIQRKMNLLLIVIIKTKFLLIIIIQTPITSRICTVGPNHA